MAGASAPAILFSVLVLLYFEQRMNVIISHTTANLPTGRFQKIAAAILGPDYQLSLTFIGSTRARSLNQATRLKDYVPNVLSFPLGDAVGEMFICPAVAQKEAKEFDLSRNGHIAFLFIHGLLHLKGYPHGDQMEKLEEKYLRKFNIT